jgi:hypothetical protein
LSEKAIKYVSKLDDEKTKNENSIFDKKKLEFEVNSKKLDENFLGTIKSKSKTTVVLETSDSEDEKKTSNAQSWEQLMRACRNTYLDSEEEYEYRWLYGDSDSDSDDDDDDDDNDGIEIFC